MPTMVTCNGDNLWKGGELCSFHVQGKMVHIRYFPVRNRGGDYMGCLEVTQDITEIQKLQGEKRLL